VDTKVSPAMANIPDERKESLDLIAAFIKERHAVGEAAALTYLHAQQSAQPLESDLGSDRSLVLHPGPCAHVQWWH
jgi:hypothetical protein